MRERLADKQIHTKETKKQHGSFVADRGVVESVEFDTAWIVFWSVLHGDHFPFEDFHAIADRKLRSSGEQHHQHHSDGRGGGETGETLRADKTRNEKNQSEKNSREVEARQRETNHQTSGIAAAENGERSWGHNETQEGACTQPQAQAQKLDGAKKGLHGETIQEQFEGINRNIGRVLGEC